MASYGYSTAPQHYHTAVSSHPHNHHHGRSRRGPRISSQNAQRQYKHLQQAQRSPKEVLVNSGVEQQPQQQQPTFNDYIARLEAAMSFEFDDDEVFCPFHLLTEDDLQSIHSTSSSDRGSLSSGSPDSSPLQQQVQPTPSFLLSAASAQHAYNPTSSAYQQQYTKLHQPLARRNAAAIPIVDPSTRVVASPPLSVSPGRQQQYVQRRGGW